MQTHWIVFFVTVAVLMAIDIFTSKKHADQARELGNEHAINMKHAVMGAVFWVGTGLLFGLYIWQQMGSGSAIEYYTAFIIEKGLSVDNIFVFIVIFSFFKVPPRFQHRVLFWGILGAMLMRALFVYLGVALIHRFEWMMIVFGLILMWTGIKTIQEGLSNDDEHKDLSKSKLIVFLKKFIPVSDTFHEDHFWVVEKGIRKATPLFLCLCMIELSDVLFAVDSVPAVLGISQDLYIVYASNIFAIFGLRALYFVVEGGLQKLKYLHYGLGAILIFIALKMIASMYFKINIIASLCVIVGILLISIVASLWIPKRSQK